MQAVSELKLQHHQEHMEREAKAEELKKTLRERAHAADEAAHASKMETEQTKVKLEEALMVSKILAEKAAKLEKVLNGKGDGADAIAQLEKQLKTAQDALQHAKAARAAEVEKHMQELAKARAAAPSYGLPSRAS